MIEREEREKKINFLLFLSFRSESENIVHYLYLITNQGHLFFFSSFAITKQQRNTHLFLLIFLDDRHYLHKINFIYRQNIPKMSTRSATSRTRNASPSSSSGLNISRAQEKEQLETLNNRLAVYIDTVRRLEHDNRELKVKSCLF
jgi:hypothetical protein